MGIFYAVSGYDIASSAEWFTIHFANMRIFMANICLWLPFSSLFPGSIGAFESTIFRLNCAC